ncbi:MAG: RagB/SusD family nutrient uptake outer membrane protein [Bacteroidales bacterium]|nr:RagB/SusD family nutrient uptake outer membrane protein [Bacteroidales bacterium]
MKKYTIIAIIFALIMAGCSKDFLDKEPQGVLSTEGFYINAENAMQAVNCCYDASRDAWTFVFTLVAMGDIASDDAEKGGSNPSDFFEMQLLKDFQITPSNWIVRAFWANLYSGIYRCNILTDRVPDIDMDAALRDRIIGEAKFLRALFYFHLIRSYGGVPLITEILDPDDFVQPRATAGEVWAQIEQDLLEAIPALPSRLEQPVSDYGRATSSAAKALLVKTYIYQKKWQQAKDLAKEIIDSYEYALVDDFASIFTLEGEFCEESIFEINFATLPPYNVGSQYMELQLPRMFKKIEVGTTDTTAGVWAGWGFNCPTEDLVNEFEPGDMRLSATATFDKDSLCTYTNEETGKQYIEIADNRMSPTGMYSKKAYVPTNQRPQAIGQGGGNAGSNIRLIRYADVLLFYGEACMEQGENAEARWALKQVRNRAGLSDYPTDPDYADLREAIYHERRVELALEHHRYWDLVRTDRGFTLPAWDPVKNGLLPIPQLEIDISQGVIVQNPGY